MTKTDQIDRTIIKLREGGIVKMFFHDFHWFLNVIERYQLTINLNFSMNISGQEIILTGVSDKDT